MSGGGKLEQLNTRERSVSSDVNRLQAFVQYDRAEILRRLVACRTSALGGGFQELGDYVDTLLNDAVPIGAPLRADVFDGLVVLPQPGTLSVLVSPGAVGLDDPDGQAGSSDSDPPNPDDSRYKVVVDPGVQIPGLLVIGAGAGSTRIDVVECQRTTVIVETDSRDLFDYATGRFVAATVTKVTEGRLTYRVRAGTPGAGMPANAQGWLPLCVVSVPSSATSVDAMVFWDVRPLCKDRISGFTDTQQVVATLQVGSQIIGDNVTDPFKTRLVGVSTSQIGMYRAGGDVGVVDIQDVANQGAGYVPLVGKPWYLYAVFPAGLPRWVRYAASPSVRVPSGPLGILALASVPPASPAGTAFLNSINVPLATGLLNSGPAVVLAAGLCAALVAVPAAVVMHDGQTILADGAVKTLAVTASTVGSDDYTFTADLDFPKTAKSLLLEFAATFSADTALSVVVDIRIPGGPTTLTKLQCSTSLALAGTAVSVVLEVPTLGFGLNLGYPSVDLEVTVEWNQSAGTKSAPSAFLLGWRL